MLDEVGAEEEFAGALGWGAVDGGAVGVEEGAIGGEVEGEDAFGADFGLAVGEALEEFPIGGDEGLGFVGLVGRELGGGEVAVDEELAGIEAALDGSAGRDERLAGVHHGEHVEVLEDGRRQTEGEEHGILERAEEADRRGTRLIRLTDVIERAVGGLAGLEEVEAILGEDFFDIAGIEIDAVEGAGAEAGKAAGSVSANAGTLEDDLAAGTGDPLGALVEGVAFGEFDEVDAVEGEGGDVGAGVVFVEDAGGDGVAGGGQGGLAEAEIGGMEEALFFARGVDEKEAADGIGFRGVEQGVAGGGRDAGKQDRGERGGSGGGAKGAAHEEGAAAFRFPLVAALDGGCALADGTFKFAREGAGGTVPMEVQLLFRKKGNTRAGHK